MEVSPGVGVRLGAVDLQDRVHGRGRRTTDLTGWWEPAASTGQVVQRKGAPGGWLSEAHATGRVLAAKVGIQSRSHADSLAMLTEITNALPLDDTTPLVVDDGGPQYLLVRQDGQPLIKWHTDTYVTYDFQMHSEMTRRLSGTGSGYSYSQTVGLPYTLGGRRYPYQLPSAFEATVVSGSVLLPVVAGTAGPVVQISFTGPVSQPTVRTLDGQAMMFDLELLAGQTLVVDLDAETVLLDGVSRQGSLRGRWLQLGPGGDTLIFDAAAYDEAARMTVSWSDSWK